MITSERYIIDSNLCHNFDQIVEIVAAVNRNELHFTTFEIDKKTI